MQRYRSQTLEYLQAFDPLSYLIGDSPVTLSVCFLQSPCLQVIPMDQQPLSTVPLGKLKIPDVEWGCITTSYTLTRLISRESFDSSSNWLTIRQAVPNIMHLEISGDRVFSQHDTLALFSLVSWCPKLELLYYPVKICRAKILIATHKAEHGLFVLLQTLPIVLHINLDILSRTSRTKSLVMRLTSRI